MLLFLLQTTTLLTFNDSTTTGFIGNSTQNQFIIGSELHHIALIISAIFGFFSCLISFWIIFNHLTHYTEPKLQKYIVRIILMIPVFSLFFYFLLYIKKKKIYTIDSFLSLLFIKDWSIYIDVLRDW